MNRKDRRIIERRKKTLQRRLDRKNFKGAGKPSFAGGNIHYEVSDRTEAMSFGGVGAIHKMVMGLELDKEINEALHLLKIHAPYYESDHVLNMAYNVLTGGTCIEDIERLRNDVTYMNSINAERIPDPTTAGDFTRRFDESSLVALMEVFNDCRARVWKKTQSESFFDLAIIDVDGTLAETLGECKQGADSASPKGIRTRNCGDMKC